MIFLYIPKLPLTPSVNHNITLNNQTSYKKTCLSSLAFHINQSKAETNKNSKARKMAHTLDLEGITKAISGNEEKTVLVQWY